MKTQTLFNEIAAIERELTELAPRVRQGFVCLGGPSERVEQAIRDEARRAAALRMRSSWPRRRMLAAAASFALLLGGTAQWFAAQRAVKDVDPAQQPAVAASVSTEESAAGFANLLLEIQGLNEDGFFRTEEAESLWL